VTASTPDGRSIDLPGRRPLIEWPVLQIVVWALLTASTAIVVAVHFANAEHRAAALNGRFLEGVKDSAPYLLVLLAAPVVWWSGGRRRQIPVEPKTHAPVRPRFIIDLLLGGGIGLLALLTTRGYGALFDGLPPAIHDEYSYLFQAQTFLLGRTWTPSFPEHAELFDQMHVLNEGRFASRYFPGTGAWLAPFVRAGDPWAGQWLANGLITAGVFAVGRLLSGRAVGVIAGLLYAVSPGMIVFSNMLVAHMPTMLGLIVFLWAILRCRDGWSADRGGSPLVGDSRGLKPTLPTDERGIRRRNSSVGLALVAGTGLAFAMLCRPMTAAGFALPFGVDWLWRWLRSLRGSAKESGPSLSQTLALGLPLVIGAAVLLAYNRSITGDALLSPYQQYTNIYTPRHVYGLNNVSRGEKQAGPKTLEHYDRWAENLTPTLAAKNVATRLINSSRWTLGTIPLLFAITAFLFDWRRLSMGWRLVFASVVSLHVAHIPYWFAGIMDWHYVFETGPLLLLIIAWATVRLAAIWRTWSAGRLTAWWGTLLATAVLVNDVTIEPLWQSRLAIAQSEAMFARGRYGVFRAEAGELARSGPIIVFVRPDPTDLHMDYVSNLPTLDGPVLVARWNPEVNALFASHVFPNRNAFVFDAATRRWSRL
jgi:hypothetical protein